MVVSPKCVDATVPDPGGDIPWRELYSSLCSLARYLVYSFSVPAWLGQENDIIEDVVQETVRRIVERSRKVERGEATPVRSLEVMMMVIASNYCKDMRRRDHRLIRMQAYDSPSEANVAVDNQLNFMETATEKVYQERLFKLLAQEIVRFPTKQRAALLTDLANRMCFEMRPTPLQQAFLDVGVDLREYRQSLPDDFQERTRYASLLNHAYKRIATLTSVQQYAVII